MSSSAGKCCKNGTPSFTPRDIYNIAHKFGKSMEQVIEGDLESLSGVTVGCPLSIWSPAARRRLSPCWSMGGAVCRIAKPTVCAPCSPLGRVVWFDRTLPLERRLDNIQVRYIVNDIDCGSAKRVNTVREWWPGSGSLRTMSSSSAGTGSLSAPAL